MILVHRAVDTPDTSSDKDDVVIDDDADDDVQGLLFFLFPCEKPAKSSASW